MIFASRLRLFCLLFPVVALSNSCGKPQEEEPVVIRPVRYQEVVPTEGIYERKFAGVTHAAIETKISFLVGGKVRGVFVKVGDQVESGHLIAELEQNDYRLQVQQSEAQEKSARAQERNAEANYNRVQSLYVSHNASLAELDASRAQMESAKAQASAVQNQLALVRSRLGYTRLKAPMAGTVANVIAEIGEVVGMGQPIVLLSSGAKLEIEVSVPETMISYINENDKVNITFDAFPEESISGVVTEVGVMSSGLATTYPVTVRLLQDNPDWRPGMAVEVTFRIVKKSEKDRIAVPSFAVGEDDQGNFVFVLEDAKKGMGIVRRRSVQIGALRNEGIEVLSGLKKKEMVITAGVSRIKDGQQVKLLGPQ